MRRAKRTLAIVAFTLVSCSTQALPASTPTSDAVTLRVYATTATFPLLNDLTSDYAETHAYIRFETRAGGFQIMFEQLTSGEQVYLVTNHLPPDSEPILAWPIGQDGIAVIVHPDNSLTGLSTDQLRSIYLGHISNWQDVGGADESIIVFSREDGSGTRAEFERLVMGERLTRQSAQVAPSSTAMVSSVAEQSGAIGYVSMSYLDDSIHTLAIDGTLPTPDTVYDNLYPLRSTLYVIGTVEPEGDYYDFIGWIQSPEGQSVVGEQNAPLLRP